MPNHHYHCFHDHHQDYLRSRATLQDQHLRYGEEKFCDELRGHHLVSARRGILMSRKAITTITARRVIVPVLPKSGINLVPPRRSIILATTKGVIGLFTKKSVVVVVMVRNLLLRLETESDTTYRRRYHNFLPAHHRWATTTANSRNTRFNCNTTCGNRQIAPQHTSPSGRPGHVRKSLPR